MFDPVGPVLFNTPPKIIFKEQPNALENKSSKFRIKLKYELSFFIYRTRAINGCFWLVTASLRFQNMIFYDIFMW